MYGISVTSEKPQPSRLKPSAIPGAWSERKGSSPAPCDMHIEDVKIINSTAGRLRRRCRHPVQIPGHSPSHGV